MPKRSSLRANIGLLAVSILVSLIVAEALLRITRIGDVRNAELYNETLFKHKPNTRVWNKKENINLVEFNNWGFHDYQREDDRDAYRILFLGDSFVEGKQVPTDSLFTVHLEQAFRGRGEAVEVVNAGFGGTGTAYQYLLWKEFFADKIWMDHVVLCFYLGNDLENNHPLLNLEALGNPRRGPFLDASGKAYVIPYPKPSAKAKLLNALSDHSALWHTVRYRLFLLRKQSDKATKEEETSGYSAVDDSLSQVVSAAWDATLEGTARLFERWHGELSELNVRFSIVFIKSPDYYLEGTYSRSVAHKEQFVHRVRALGARASLPILELDFGAFSPYAIYSFDGLTLGHFNYRGHRVAAEQMFQWLRGII